MKFSILFLFVFSSFLVFAQTVEQSSYSYNWYDNSRDYRTFFIVESGSNSFIDKPVEFDINFTTLLQTASNSDQFDMASIRVIEISPSLSLIDSNIVYQFDADSDFNSITKASGKITFLMSGITAPNSTRYFHIYFDAGNKDYQPVNFANLVSFEDNVEHEGQSSFKIQTTSGLYYYHKAGAGFASIEDINGNDWVGYSSSQIDLSFRGIPNLGTWAHPGYTNSASSIKSSGPLKLIIESVKVGNIHKLRWEIYPEYARLTIIEPGENYFFQYEGVPGGSWDHNSDYVVKNNAQRSLVSQSWTNYELSDPEWVYFGDNSMERVIYFTNHQSDQLNDYYKPHDTSYDPYKMTVFAFGRQDPYDPNTSRLLSASNAKFTFGFFEDSVFTNVREAVLSSSNEPTVNLNPSPIKLSVKAFLQGPYNNGSMSLTLNQAGWIPTEQPYSAFPWNYTGIETASSIPSNTVDWVLIELRRSTSSNSIIKKQAAFIRNDGYLINSDGSFPLKIDGIGEADFYLVLRHRNHLGIMSATPILLINGIYETDFTSNGSVYGINPMNLHSDGNYSLRSGDGNATGSVSASDNNLVWRPQNGSLGYLMGDFNLTGSVSASDTNLHWRINNGRISQIPN